MEPNEQLKTHIQNGQIIQAIELVRSAKDHHISEGLVVTVLEEEKSSPELVEAVLEAFLCTRENRYQRHGAWVHSLSHFTRSLWERRMDRWVKKFNEVAFKGAIELGDPNCSDRLVSDFGKYAKFDDDPADFALTPQNLRWMDWKYHTYAKARIEAARVKSEADFLRWKLRRPEVLIAFDFDAQVELVNLDGIRAIVQRLQELGANVTEFDGLERDMLTRQLSELEAKLAAATTQDWRRKYLEKGIEKTRTALETIR